MLRNNETRVIHSLGERFRCPDEFLKYQPDEKPSQTPSHFELSNGTVLCRRSAVTTDKQTTACCGEHYLASLENGKDRLVLPFDPDEVIDSLRLERYPGCQFSDLEKKCKSAYYRIRPLTSQRVRDCIKRIRATKSTPGHFPNWPVDTTVESVFDRLLLDSLNSGAVDRIPFIWFWPKGARGCVSITHDVETAEGQDFCTDLMDLDDSFGMKSSFQIVPAERYAVAQRFLTRFQDRGFELCVHDLNHDGRLFDEIGEFRRRAALINCYGRQYNARGFRSAMLYRKAEWFEYLEFSFDMSVPNVAHFEPQHGGCCTVMPYFIGQLVELPLTTIQDYVLFHVLRRKSIDLWRLQLQLILDRNGLATFLVHPDYILEGKTLAVYKDLLAMLRDVRVHGDIWFALPGEIDAWWRERKQMSIIRDGHSWRIAGAGAERAKLAFARVVDGALIYEMAENMQMQDGAIRMEGSTAHASV